jgi:hypothetical protein
MPHVVNAGKYFAGLTVVLFSQLASYYKRMYSCVCVCACMHRCVCACVRLSLSVLFALPVLRLCHGCPHLAAFLRSVCSLVLLVSTLTCCLLRSKWCHLSNRCPFDSSCCCYLLFPSFMTATLGFSTGIGSSLCSS